MVEIDRRKAALIAEIEISRSEIRSAVRQVETATDLLGRVRKNISNNLGLWLLGAASGGILISKVFRSRKATETPSGADHVTSSGAGHRWLSSGMLLSVAKIGFDLSKPIILDWVANRITQTPEAHHPEGNKATRQ